ncbi:MAG TPA: hypothetical protein GXX17_04915 [Clostridiales bacterium]|nr:hypothetical protein [Clostridiales bacterium]
MANKIFVDVVVKYDAEGNIIPLSILWEDGRIFEIDKVVDVRPAPSLKAGGQGIRFTCRIQNKYRYLFFEEPRWFVEGS